MLRTMSDNVLMATQETRPGSETDDSDRISVGGAVARICLLVALLVVVNIPTEGLGLSLTRTETGLWIVSPLLRVSPSGLNLWLTSSLALWVVNLYYGRWQRATRWADFGLSVLGIVVLGQLLKAVLPGVSNVHDLVQSARALNVEDLGAWATLAVSVALVIALVDTFVEAVKKLTALVRPKRG
jgi:hypothetical protein